MAGTYSQSTDIFFYRFNIDNSILAPYFSLGSCMDGLGMLLERLYGVKLDYEQPEYGELWSYDVHKLVSTKILIL